LDHIAIDTTQGPLPLELIVELDGERNQHLGEQSRQGQTRGHEAIIALPGRRSGRLWTRLHP